MPSHQIGEQAGARMGCPRLPEKCHHFSTMIALAGVSRVTHNTGFSSEYKCILVHQTSG